MFSRTAGGRLFHTAGPLYAKLRCPVEVWTRGSRMQRVDADRSRGRPRTSSTGTQSNLARVVCGVSKFQLRLSEDVLHELHWLPIRQRIHYKIATITYRALHLQQPTYIASLLVNYIPPRTLRSTSQGLLNTPGSWTLIGARHFSSAAPVIWNKLPYTVRSAETIGTFRTRLKTHLFPVIAS